MESDNIIAVNVPNLVTITIMAVVGGVILGVIRRFALQAMGQGGGGS